MPPLFSQAPDEAIKFWWEEWRKRFRFVRGDEANIRKAWEIRAAKRHRGMMHNIREKGAPHQWIPDDIFRRYLDYWASADYQAAEIRCVPSQSEVFLWTYTRKKDRGQFVDEQSEQQIEQHKADVKYLEDERAARIATGEPAGPPIDKDELVDPEHASTCNGPDAREHITLLNMEIQQQAEAYKQEMEAWKRRYETDVTRLQTTLDTQSAEFDQWKSTASQMYSFMQQMQGSSSSSMPPPLPPPPSSAPRPPRPPPVATTGAPTATDHHLDDDGSSTDDEDYD
ncbi:hypothetical protein PIB30_085896 [Stylosanthes scabra]|uniref:Uncharacterized protein n=1 Tax=Stylosanthes scabra TaxID=79078 RepID=A0ABU6USE6_9FABA|nr:hypothetical protein [Stylosanthes scabra]